MDGSVEYLCRMERWRDGEVERWAGVGVGVGVGMGVGEVY